MDEFLTDNTTMNTKATSKAAKAANSKFLFLEAAFFILSSRSMACDY
jgi:hypothetical protein